MNPLLKRCLYVRPNIIHLRIGPEELTEGWCPAVLSICGLIVRRTIRIILEINTCFENSMAVAVLVILFVNRQIQAYSSGRDYQIIFKVKFLLKLTSTIQSQSSVFCIPIRFSRRRVRFFRVRMRFILARMRLSRTGWLDAKNVILYVMDGPCRLPWRTTPLAPVWMYTKHRHELGSVQGRHGLVLSTLVGSCLLSGSHHVQRWGRLLAWGSF
jgi:hypothetical protein